MGGSKGIEPILKVPQTSVLPLHQQPHVVGRPGIEPGESKTTDLQSAPLPSTEYRPINARYYLYGGRAICLNAIYTWVVDKWYQRLDLNQWSIGYEPSTLAI